MKMKNRILKSPSKLKVGDVVFGTLERDARGVVLERVLRLLAAEVGE